MLKCSSPRLINGWLLVGALVQKDLVLFKGQAADSLTLL